MGRLFRHLREEKGYTYGIGSGISATNIRGDWTASTVGPHRSHRAGAHGSARRDRARCATCRCRPTNWPTPSARSSASFALSLESPQADAELLRRTAGCTACRPTTGTPTRRRSAPSPAADAQARREEVLGSMIGCRSSRSATAPKIGPIVGKYGPVGAVPTRRARRSASSPPRQTGPLVGDPLHRRGEGVDLLERRVDVRRDPDAFVLGVDDRRRDDPPLLPQLFDHLARRHTPTICTVPIAQECAGSRLVWILTFAFAASRVAQRLRR